VIKFTFIVMCSAHWMACAWYLMHVLQEHGDGGSTWVVGGDSWIVLATSSNAC
jgi:hypothetical protein